MNTRPIRIATAALIVVLGGACQRAVPPSSSPASSHRLTTTATGNTKSEAGKPVASMPPATTSLSSDTLNAFVDKLLRAEYPQGWDAAHNCWQAHYGTDDEAIAYCMRPLPPAVVMEDGKQVIYVATASAADIQGDPAYSYGAVDPGMFDAFRLSLASDGRTELTGVGKGLDFGSVGDCGCADADLVPLGPAIHGWVFSSGSTQQGITTATHSLVAPVDGVFKDVASIPRYVEEEPDVEYRIAIASENPVAGWFPLTVAKYRGDRKLVSRQVVFNGAAQRYLMPKNF
jgi:hypothetical protein